MTSIRMRSRSRSRTDDSSRYGRFGVPESSEEERDFPSSLSRLARQEAASNRLANPASTSSRAQQSRLPQMPTTRRPSATSSTRQAPSHDDSSWSTVTSATARSNTIGVQEKEILSSQPRSMLRRKPTGISRIAVAAESKPHLEVTKPSSSSAATRSDSSVRYGHPALRTEPEKPRPSFESSSDIEGSNYRVYPELDRYRGIEPVSRARDGLASDALYPLATDLPPPTPLFSGASSQSQLSTFSASPSTRWSESPGPGPYSRDTTPTSMSSQSPGLVAPMRLPATKLGRASPADSRPPVTRRRAGSTSKDVETFGSESSGLAAVREVASSSSNSTVRTDDRTEKTKRERAQASIPTTAAQRQPHRLQKPQKDNASPSKVSRAPAKTVMRSPSPVRSRRPSQDQSSSTLTSPQPRPGMPSRPSRDGTPDLYSQFGGPMPVIHSNLSTSSVNERRQSGQLLPSSLPRSSASSTERPAPTKAAVPNVTHQTQSTTGQARGNRTPSPSVPSFRSRFPIFGRKKSTADEGQSVKAEKPARKGPAAGTGHEGYGRLGAVKRRSSSGAPSPRGLTGPVSSSESLAITDTFLLERLNPVIISGGEVVENRNNSTEFLRAEMGTNAQSRRPSVDQCKGSTTSISSKDEFRSGLAPSPLPRATATSRRPSESSDSEAISMQSTLAFRRSLQRTGSPDKAAVKIPKPIVTRGFKSPSINSVDTTILSDDSFSMVASGLGNTTMASGNGPKKLTKKVKSPRKWGIFGRSQGSSSKETKKTTEKAPAPPVKPVNKPVAFYTMLDSSEQEDNEEKPMQAILADADVLQTKELNKGVMESRPSVDSQAESIRVAAPDLVQERKTSVSEQSSQKIAPLQAQATPAPLQPLQEPIRPQPQPASAAPKPKSSRLPQVGRIPKVVTSRPEHTSPKSFSRPFHRLSQQLQVPEATTSAIQTPLKNERSLKKIVTPEATCDDATDFECSEDENIDEDITILNPQFIAFSPPRKDSESTTCTSNSSYLNHTAITPQPSAPLQEDEIWDEYNDFIGEPPASATSSCGTPFHLERYESHLARKRSNKTAESPTIKFQPSKDFQVPKIVRDSIENGPALTASSHYSADMAARINAAFRFESDVPPSTPFSVTKFVSSYGDRNLSPEDGARAATASPDEAIQPDPASSSPGKTTSESEINDSTTRNSANSTSSSRSSQESPLSQVNLRVGSMTVSKWLTFGQVLFSPVRDDLVNVVGSLKRHAILVIDGLGNDDWSFYAAETYPAATFFNLSPRAPIAKEQATSSFPLSPPNHHQIQHNSYLEKFPFGPDTFTSVVFRFPAAAPEAHFRNIISETRRVLKPGGYVELSILDADLNNVGSRTRRAARRLKEQVAAKHPDYNLGSTSDMMLRLLGRKGFVDVKTCRVGVPVASAVANAQVGERGKKDERSLAEMMRDETEKGDENITKMVSKVGRWWYNRCYESSTTSKSIWSDKAVLAECEQWGTSLKLMVCHARMPEGAGRHASL